MDDQRTDREGGSVSWVRRMVGVALYLAAAILGCIAMLMLFGCVHHLIFYWNSGPFIAIPSLSLALFGGSALLGSVSFALILLGSKIYESKQTPK